MDNNALIDSETEKQDNRPTIYKLENGLMRYRPSGLAKCMRAMVAARLEFPPEPFDEDILTIFDEGRLHEDSIVATVEEKWGIEVERHVRGRVPVGDFAEVSGACDGVNKRVLVEAKAFSDAQYEIFKDGGIKGFPDYEWQISAYYWGLRSEERPLDDGIIFAVKNRNSGKKWFEEIHRPRYSQVEIENRVAQIEGLAVLAMAMKEETGAYRWPECGTYSHFCNYSYLHETSEEGKAGKEGVRDDLLITLVAEYYKLQCIGAYVKKQKAEMRLAIEHAIQKRPRTYAGPYTVSMITPKDRTTLDEAGLRKAYPDIANAFTKTRKAEPYLMTYGPKEVRQAILGTSFGELEGDVE